MFVPSAKCHRILHLVCSDSKLRDELRDNNTKNKKCVNDESDNISENEGKSAKFTQQIKYRGQSGLERVQP